MWGPDTWMGVVNGIGTIALTAFAIDRGYRLAIVWITLNHKNESELRLTRQAMLGPKPILLTTLHASSVVDPTIPPREDFTG